MILSVCLCLLWCVMIFHDLFIPRSKEVFSLFLLFSSCYCFQVSPESKGYCLLFREFGQQNVAFYPKFLKYAYALRYSLYAYIVAYNVNVWLRPIFKKISGENGTHSKNARLVHKDIILEIRCFEHYLFGHYFSDIIFFEKFLILVL